MNNIKAFIYKDMKRNATFKVLLMFIVGLFLSVNTFAQQIVVKGIVKDTTGEPIIGANVIVKGTTNGTITDFDGNFLLNANKGDYHHFVYRISVSRSTGSRFYEYYIKR